MDAHYVCEKFWAFVHVSVYVWACVLSLPVHWAAAVLVHALCCPGFGPTEHNVWSEGERRWEKAERGVGGGGCTEGAVCHCESAQGGSHHLAIDGCPSPVVKQAPVGLPEHWGHCVPPLQETCHPKCCYPPPPPSTHSISSPLPSPSRSILSTLAPAQPCVNLKLAVKATRHNGVARSFECNR